MCVRWKYARALSVGLRELSYDDLARLDATGKLERWGYQSETHSIRYKDANVSVQFYDSEMLDLMRGATDYGALSRGGE